MRDKRIRVSTPFHRDDRGVSEVLAFVLVFGIILSSVTILSMTGFQAMESYQENEQQRNADRAMIALSDNFNDVLRHSGTEQRYGELAVRGGTVTVDGDAGPEIEVKDENGADIIQDQFSHLTTPLTLGSFTYESGSETIAYEGGAVVREGTGSGGIDLAEPQFRYNESREVAIVSLVKIDGPQRSIQSDGSQGFTITVENRSTAVVDSASEISIEANGDREDIWTKHILEEDDWHTSRNVERILITVVEVEISY